MNPRSSALLALRDSVWVHVLYGHGRSGVHAPGFLNGPRYGQQLQWTGLQAANGSTIKCSGEATLDVHVLCWSTLPWTFHRCDVKCPLLRADVLLRHQLLVDVAGRVC